MKKVYFAIPLILLTFIIFQEPGPIWFFPIFLLAYIFEDKIKRKAQRSLFSKYVITGLVVGILIELLAIINTANIPLGERALFHQLPIPDLILAAGYYAALFIGSFIIVKKYNFSVKQLFILGGVFGLIFEQFGIILLSFSLLNYAYVFLSYGSFLALPYLIYKDNFKKRNKISLLRFIKSFFILVFFYLIFSIYFFILNPLFG